MCKRYTNGMIVFLDILGFSKFIESTTSPSEVENIFKFTEKISYLYNTSDINNVKVTFFSDSFILTTEEISGQAFTSLMIACHMINLQLYEATKLFTRGALSVGDYYHVSNTAFGPGIIDAYKNQEKNAKYARLIISNVAIDILKVKITKQWFLEQDIDGFWYYNYYLLELSDAFIDGKFDMEKAEKIMGNNKEKIINRLETYSNTQVFDKYKWLVTPYNNCCRKMSSEYMMSGFDKFIINL